MRDFDAMPVLPVVIVVVSTLFSYIILLYDNFPYPGSRRYSEDETDRSAHSGSADSVIKLENCPFSKSRANI